MKNRILFSLAIFSMLIAYFIGVSVGKQGISYALDVTQGELAFNHLKRYRVIKEDLESGCLEEALEKLSFYVDEQMMLLAEYVQHHKVEAINSYIAKRDDTLLGQLKSYEIDWKKEWVEKKCQEI
ncbi:hypothetical protein [Marinobacterium marinum]|uniref:Uncharacterized protein n=1 Tax=Marinobacterium marinum TaxID=2756129 RepID=A0A7W1X0F7_9GAMM|nr:hypothetical protein [Marinobacterium marinum]MBA4503451.1 hypothetical protein [Marinobacterium marinum]